MEPTPLRPIVLDSEQVGDLLGIKASTVDVLARRGDLPSVMIGNGKIRRFLRRDVEEFVAERRAA